MPSSSLKRPHLRVVGLAILSALLLLSACSRPTAEDLALDSALKRYDHVRSGMTKHEVVTLLGEPSGRQEDRYRWQANGRPNNSASIEVRFDRDGKVTSIARTRVKS